MAGASRILPPQVKPGAGAICSETRRVILLLRNEFKKRIQVSCRIALDAGRRKRSAAWRAFVVEFEMTFFVPFVRIARSGSSQERSGPRRVFRTKGQSEGGSGRGPEVVRQPACQNVLLWRDGRRTRTARGRPEERASRGRPDRTEREKPPQATAALRQESGFQIAIEPWC